jgi:hypothetical protein
VKNTFGAIFFVAFGLLLSSGPLSAHHGNAAFDGSKKVTVKGTVTEWVWGNPHCFLKMDVKGEDGQVIQWVVEATAAPSLLDIGVTKRAFKPGDQLTVTMTPVKTGQPIGRVMNAVLPNGKTLYFTPEGSGIPPGHGQDEEELMKINQEAQASSR